MHRYRRRRGKKCVAAARIRRDIIPHLSRRVRSARRPASGCIRGLNIERNHSNCLFHSQQPIVSLDFVEKFKFALRAGFQRALRRTVWPPWHVSTSASDKQPTSRGKRQSKQGERREKGKRKTERSEVKSKERKYCLSGAKCFLFSPTNAARLILHTFVEPVARACVCISLVPRRTNRIYIHGNRATHFTELFHSKNTAAQINAER